MEDTGDDPGTADVNEFVSKVDNIIVALKKANVDGPVVGIVPFEAAKCSSE